MTETISLRSGEETLEATLYGALPARRAAILGLVVGFVAKGL